MHATFSRWVTVQSRSMTRIYGSPATKPVTINFAANIAGSPYRIKDVPGIQFNAIQVRAESLH